MLILATQDHVTLETLKKENFVLFFYSKNNTSACSLEADEFAALYPRFLECGFNVYGISKDTLGSHKKFTEKRNLPFALMSDEERVIHEAFNVIVNKTMYGKPVRGTERSTFIFTKGLKQIHAFRNVKAPNHAQTVLDFVEGLTQSS